jgi:hypothetical protein
VANVPRSRGIFLAIAILALPLIGLLYMTPRQVEVNVIGIEYRLGNPDIQKTVVIRVEGTVQRRILDETRFRGNIHIDGQSLLDVDTTLNQEGDLIMARNIESGEFKSYGALYAPGSFERFTIAVLETLEAEEADPAERFWDTNSGLMISAPANNRFEALRLSNEIMEPILQHDLE